MKKEDDEYLDFQAKLQNECESLQRCHKPPPSCNKQFRNDHANCNSTLDTICDH